VILLQPTKFRNNPTIGGEVMTSYRFFKMAAIKSEVYFRSGIRLSDGTCLRRWISVCIPNFDDISQCTAEINLLPVSENGKPPYYICTLGFDFNRCAVTGVSFCIQLPDFVAIRHRWRCYDVISIFQDGGHKIGNLLSCSGFVTALV